MGIGIILVLATLTALLSNIIFGHQFRKTLTRLQAEGRPTTIAELRTTSIPVDQNAARLFEKAALLLTKKARTGPHCVVIAGKILHPIEGVLRWEEERMRRAG